MTHMEIAIEDRNTFILHGTVDTIVADDLGPDSI